MEDGREIFDEELDDEPVPTKGRESYSGIGNVCARIYMYCLVNF